MEMTVAIHEFFPDPVFETIFNFSYILDIKLIYWIIETLLFQDYVPISSY